ncbi:hypothetical protein [Streptomyces chrestomyceticus]|uniref:hypothetical protein n=1 Tax=Streptomyces chrestomyceticus TaxID=68185 RepID=UPI003794EA1B
MRKILAAAAAAGTLLMAGAGSASAAGAEEPWSKPWSGSVTGASAKGVFTDEHEGGPDQDKEYRLTGTLTVTDKNPDNCYYVQAGAEGIGKPKPPRWWGTPSARQCGPGTIKVTSSVQVGWTVTARIVRVAGKG